MNEAKTYSVGAFAQLAGVTVRTLHFYDEAGLLKPSARIDTKHRRYQQDDLLRLQQILTLKRLGFSLQEIETLLESQSYDVRQSLRIQRDAIAQQISQLQSAYYALTRTLEAVEAGKGIDWMEVAAIIQGLSDPDKNQWMQRYYREEDWDWLRDRAMTMTPEQVELGARAWTDLYDDFKTRQHLAPDHPDVQALAARMNRLIEMFTEGRPEIEESLKQLYSNIEHIPMTVRRDDYDQDLQNFATKALTIYRKNREDST
jgi:MerR family transcriptional regulator, thiopeptide resistance regulator